MTHARQETNILTIPTQAQIEAARETPSRKVQLQCHTAVRRAIESGALMRLDQCQRCGSKPPPNRAGVSQIHAHHEDHSKPLEIEWLCVACHRFVTPWPSKPCGKAFGTVNGAAKLNEAKVRYIRKQAKKLSSRKIAALIGVDPRTVQRVITGERWPHVR